MTYGKASPVVFICEVLKKNLFLFGALYNAQRTAVGMSVFVKYTSRANLADVFYKNAYANNCALYKAPNRNKFFLILSRE